MLMVAYSSMEKCTLFMLKIKACVLLLWGRSSFHSPIRAPCVGLGACATQQTEITSLDGV